jgi:hypothetical protein
MCPVCLATVAVIAGSATGTGGLSAFVAQKLLRKKSTAAKESQDDNHDNKHPASEGGLAR